MNEFCSTKPWLFGESTLTKTDKIKFPTGPSKGTLRLDEFKATAKLKFGGLPN
jgi:hypothetical protein